MIDYLQIGAFWMVTLFFMFRFNPTSKRSRASGRRQ